MSDSAFQDLLNRGSAYEFEGGNGALAFPSQITPPTLVQNDMLDSLGSRAAGRLAKYVGAVRRSGLTNRSAARNSHRARAGRLGVQARFP